MTKTQLPVLIVWVNRTGLVIHGPHLSDVVTVPYPDATVKELELISPKSIKLMLSNLVSQYQVPKSEVIIVLDKSVYFEKVIETEDLAEQDKFVAEFKDSVPLESVFARKFDFDSQHKVIAFNKLFYNALVKAFGEIGFVPKLLVPDFIVSQIIGVSNLTLESSQLLSSSFDKLKEFSLLSLAEDNKAPVPSPQPAPEAVQAKNSQPQVKPKTSNKRMYMLAAAFGVLLIILVVMVIVNLG